MNINYSWKITGLKTKTEGPHEKAVVQAYWQKRGTTDTGEVGVFMGATPFSTLNMPEDYEFIPFEQLTEETVLNWIKATVTGPYEQHVNEHIQRQINNQVEKKIEAQLPWLQSQELTQPPPPPPLPVLESVPPNPEPAPQSQV